MKKPEKMNEFSCECKCKECQGCECGAALAIMFNKGFDKMEEYYKSRELNVEEIKKIIKDSQTYLGNDSQFEEDVNDLAQSIASRFMGTQIDVEKVLKDFDKKCKDDFVLYSGMGGTLYDIGGIKDFIRQEFSNQREKP